MKRDKEQPMRYLIDIRLDTDKKRTYPIDAKNETEAIERLKLRLPPSQRNNLIIDTIRIDPISIRTEEPYGIFGGE